MKKLGLLLKTFYQTRWKRKFSTREDLTKYQEKKKEEYYEFLKEKIPYFQKHPLTKDFRMNKELMMNHFSDFNSLAFQKDRVLEIALESERSRDFSKSYGEIAVGLSSGTSGHRSIFLTSEEERAIWAGSILAKVLPKGKLFGHRIAFFLRADNKLYQSLSSFFLKLEYFDTLAPMEEHCKRLQTLRPTILVAPASMLLALAREQEKGNCCIEAQKIISVAEILEKSDEGYLKEVFQVEYIHQIYQATEGFLACTCEYGHLHLNEDLIFFEKEYLDEKRFYPIITDFSRRSQAFVQYRLNDILIENKEPCPCGSVFCRLESIEGRADDVFFFWNKKGEKVTVYSDFIRRILLLVEGIREYQVFQQDYKLLHIAILEGSQKQEEALRKEFQTFFASQDIEGVQIEWIPYQVDRGKKLKRIIQCMKEERR